MGTRECHSSPSKTKLHQYSKRDFKVTGLLEEPTDRRVAELTVQLEEAEQAVIPAVVRRDRLVVEPEAAERVPLVFPDR